MSIEILLAIVCRVNDRKQAIQIVKDHYGSGNIKKLSAKIWKE